MNEIERWNFEFLTDGQEEDELKQMLYDIMFNKPEPVKEENEDASSEQEEVKK